jgi:DNA polymerase
MANTSKHKTLHVDFETASEAELTDVGASKYSKHPTTIVTILSYRFDEGPIIRVTLPKREDLPTEISDHINRGGVLEAWNASFEVAIFKNYFGLDIPVNQISCTMQRAMYAGYPAKLGDAGDAMGVEVVKDKSARALMMKMAKPRKATKKRAQSWWYDDAPELLEPLGDYCDQDVAAEIAASETLPQLPPREVVISQLYRLINSRGLRMDVALIEQMIALVENTGEKERARVEEITRGAVTNVATQTKRLTEWLKPHGVPSLGKEILAEQLQREDLPAEVMEVLQIRSDFAKSSVAKLRTMKDWLEEDDRARGLLQYYGAKTGRWSGRGPQPQNYFKSVIKDVSAAIESIQQGMGAQGIELFHGPVLDVVASCLRGTIIPSEGKTFAVLDLNAIEARTAAWVAGQNDVVDVFKAGQDVYQHVADKLNLGSRQAGKVATLGLTYSMGPQKFIDYAAGYGLELTLEKAEEIVSAWREGNAQIVGLWRRIDECVRAVIHSAVEHPTRKARMQVNDWLSVQVSPARNGQPLMTLELPSGRLLFYRNIAIELDPRSDRMSIAYDAKGKIWGRQYTYSGKIFENLNQAIARDVMCEMMLEIEKQKLGEIVLSVHDEVLVEVPDDLAKERFEAINSCMNTTPSWAPGLPVKAAGGLMKRYSK